jgi:kynurenine formamidase
MCVPGCQEVVRERLSRRGFLKAATAATLATATAQVWTGIALANHESDDVGDVFGRPFHQVVDLTHVLTPGFPTYSGDPQLEITPLFTYDPDFFNMNLWTVNEHTGTHMDAPRHFSADQDTADMIPVSKLVLPLIVVDRRAKAEGDPDSQVTRGDLEAWEESHGRIPKRACVAMLSGWADKVHSDEFRNADSGGVMHFPGFDITAADFLIDERDVEAIAVDTLSLDYGMSPDFAVHYRWLGSNRWGMENLANLDKLPAKGSTIVAGGPKIEGATGGPSRVIALVHGGRGRGPG